MEYYWQTDKSLSSYSGRVAVYAAKLALQGNLKCSRVSRRSNPERAITEPKICFLLQCPNEIILKIANYLKLKDVFTFMRTSHDLHAILDIPLHNQAPNHTYRNGYNVLEWAAEEDKATLIKKLQTPRRQKAFSTHSKNQALFLATAYGHLECISLLLTMGAEVSCLVSGIGPLGASAVKETPLHHAAINDDLAVVELLLAHGADLHAVTSKGETPLQYAVDRGDETCVRLFLEKGADIGSVANLNIAIRLKYERTILLLLEMGVNPTSAPLGGLTAGWTAMLSAMFWCMRLMKPLLENGADPDMAIFGERKTLLHHAVLHGKTQAMQLLLNYSANISALDDNGFQPLHLAVCAGISSPNDAWWKCKPRREIVRLLLKGGAKISDIDDHGHTALDYALRWDDHSIIELMLQDLYYVGV